MNRFVIVDGLPFLLANKKTYGVRWDEKGFTVGTEVELASVPAVTFSELSILAKCQGHLDSITEQQEQQSEGQEENPEESMQTEQQEQQSEGQEDEFANMKVAELKEYAAAHEIDLGKATKKAEILETIRNAVQDVTAE